RKVGDVNLARGADSENHAHTAGRPLEPAFLRVSHLLQGQLQLAFELERVTAGHPEQCDLDVVPARERLKLRRRTGRSADDEPAGRLAGECRGEAERPP